MRPDTARLAGFDALKAWTTVLVVFHHTAITYGAIGGWFYREVATDRSPASLLLVFFCTINQAWFMGLFFLLAGRFTPAALQRKGAGPFVRDRLLRLGLPWLVFGYALGPVTLALARTARGDDFSAGLLRLWGSASFVNGPTWFASALLAFSLIVACAPRGWSARPAQQRAVPRNGALLLAALGSAGMAFGVRLVWPVGTDVAGWQLGYFPMYVLLFWVGCQAGRHGWLEALPAAQVRRWRRVAWLALPMLLPLAFLASRFPVLQGPATGGWNVPSLMYAVWEPLVAWGVLLALVQWAAKPRKLGPGPGPASGPGRFQQALARRAYAIFVIHPPVLVAVAVAWRAVAAPVLLKFAVTGSVACVLCFALAGALLRVPALRRVL